MKIIYDTNYKSLKNKYKNQLEDELLILEEKYWFINLEKDQIHVKCNRFKENSSNLKLEIWLNKIGKMIAVSSTEDNLHTAINQCKIKLDHIFIKIKEKNLKSSH